MPKLWSVSDCHQHRMILLCFHDLFAFLRRAEAQNSRGAIFIEIEFGPIMGSMTHAMVTLLQTMTEKPHFCVNHMLSSMITAQSSMLLHQDLHVFLWITQYL
jgi:cobalamin-dependent methionine synthase I